MWMQSGSRIRNLGPVSFHSLIPPSLAKNLKRWVSGVLQKLIQQSKPWGGDPGAALMGRGWTGRGRGSSRARDAGRDPVEGLRGEALVHPGAPGSCGRRGPWIPPHSKVKAHPVRHQLRRVGAEFSKASVGGGRRAEEFCRTSWEEEGALEAPRWVKVPGSGVGRAR